MNFALVIYINLLFRSMSLLLFDGEVIEIPDYIIRIVNKAQEIVASDADGQRSPVLNLLDVDVLSKFRTDGIYTLLCVSCMIFIPNHINVLITQQTLVLCFITGDRYRRIYFFCVCTSLIISVHIASLCMVLHVIYAIYIF